jgi:hypothetical protein
MHSAFAVWLHGQTRRPDTVGLSALVLLSSRRFRTNRSQLHVLLNSFPPATPERFAVKVAHREWRRVQANLLDEAKAS